MASRAAQMLVEADPDDGAVAAQSGSALPPGLTGSVVELPRPRGNQQQAEPDFEIVETDDAGQPLQTQQPPATAAEPEQQGAPQQQPEPQQGADATPRPRDNRADRRIRQQRGRDNTLRENAMLRAQVEELRQAVSGFEPRFAQIGQVHAQQQLTDLDRQLTAAHDRAAHARRQLTEAIAAGDHDQIGAALDARDQAIADGQRLTMQKTALEANIQRTRPQQTQQQPQRQAQQPAPLPAVVRALAEDFMDAHDWYDPNGADMDSRIVQQIDNAVAADGFDPSSQEYWDEIEDRMQRYLPHRFSQQQPRPQPQHQVQQPQPAPQRRGPAVAGASDAAPQPGRNQVYLSPQRKEAMVQAGALERDGRTVADKAKFQRLLAQYQAFDRANGVARQ